MLRTSPKLNGPWVDLFSKAHFGGRIHRIRPRTHTRKAVFQNTDLPVFRSIIVGPKTSVRVNFHGTARVLDLAARSVLPDVKPYAQGQSIRTVLLVPSDQASISARKSQRPHPAQKPRLRN